MTGTLPDLALQDFGLLTVGPSAGFLRVDIANYGQRDLVQQGIEIVGFDQTGAQVLRRQLDSMQRVVRVGLKRLPAMQS